ncbi:MAG: 6-phospho-beta-glucosidase [Candidatus Atribacteria bacterium]|nr:MAG: 6-phospho-beta-glucosidase [Candidatus Atribacteria bacterium]
MKSFKIAIIGAGSTYTPELIDGFIKRKNELPVTSFYLMDIDERKLKIVGNFAQKMLDANDIKCKFVMTENLKTAVKDADFVLSQVRVGKLDARIKDEKIPLKHGLIGQETTGIGGFMKALRTIPVIMNIAEFIENYSPDAWLINFSNPSGIIAEALLNNTNIKMIGLCNTPIIMKREAIQRAPEGVGNIRIDYVGLNHLSWITAIYCDGREILQGQLLEKFDFMDMENIPKMDMDKELIKSIRSIPSSYLQYYYCREQQLKQMKEEKKCRGEVCLEIEEELLKLYQQAELIEKPAILDQRGGHLYSEVAVSLVSAIYNNKNEEHIVNVKNNGALDFMANDDVVEISCKVNKNGAAPLPLKNMDNDHIKDMMRIIKAYEKHTIRAGIYGDYHEALKALLIHPLVGDFRKAKDALDDLLEAHKEFLPQFFNK